MHVSTGRRRSLRRAHSTDIPTDAAILALQQQGVLARHPELDPEYQYASPPRRRGMLRSGSIAAQG